MMKKLCALILVLLFMTGFQSAGYCASAEYDALHEQLNAENYEGIVEELCRLSPVFAENYAALEKYRSLIDAMEQRDYTAARADMEQRIRETSSECEAVEITSENWSEYFYIVIEEHYDVDSFGNPRGYWQDGLIKLKDEYLVRLAENMDNDVRFNFHYLSETVTLKVDFVNKTYEITGKLVPLTLPDFSWSDSQYYKAPTPTAEAVIDETCEVQASFYRNADNERMFSGYFCEYNGNSIDSYDNTLYARENFLEYEVLDAIGTIWLYKE